MLTRSSTRQPLALQQGSCTSRATEHTGTGQLTPCLLQCVALTRLEGAKRQHAPGEGWLRPGRRGGIPQVVPVRQKAPAAP